MTRFTRALLAGLALLGGCGVSIGPKEIPEVTYYHLTMSEPASAPVRYDLVLAVRPFSQEPALDRDGIRYRESDVEGGYYRSHQWAEPVYSMVRGALQADLAGSGMFKQVVLLDQSGYADVMLAGEVIRFEEEDRPDGWFGVVEVAVDILRRDDSETGEEGGDRVVLSRRYRGEARAEGSAVSDVVRALSRALAGVLGDLREDLVTVLGEEER